MKKKIIPWLMASRPKTLTASFAPVFVATMLALANTGQVDWLLSLYAFMAAVFIQMGTNLINDALDFKKGADTKHRLGPVRVTQSGLLTYTQVLSGGIVCFVTALLFGIPLVINGGWPFVWLLGVSVVCGYAYTGGPFPLAYKGLGDVFVLLFFGLIATVAVYYLQTATVDVDAFVAGLQIGFLATVMIAINNLRDVKGDAKAKKRTLPVRFGVAFGKWEIYTLISLTFILNVYWIAKGYFWAGNLPFGLIPTALMIVKGVQKEVPGVKYNQFLVMAAFLQIAFALLLGLGFWFE